MSGLLTHTIFKNTKIVRQSREPTVVTYYTVGAFCILLQLCKHRTAGNIYLISNLISLLFRQTSFSIHLDPIMNIFLYS